MLQPSRFNIKYRKYDKAILSKENNTIQYLHLYHAHGQLLRLNLRQRQLTWQDGMVTLRGGTSQIICLKMLLAKEGATVNFDRDFIPY